MNFYNVKLVLSVLIIFISIKIDAKRNKNKLPSFLNICQRNDPHLNDCIKKSVENLRPLLRKGIPEFDIPSCEPLHIPEVVIDQGAGPLSIKSSYKDIQVSGPTDFTLKSIRIDLEKNRVRIKLWLPKLEVMCQYELQGKILMMPISGSGESHGNYSNIDVTITMQGQQIKKGDDVYFNIKDFVVDFNIGYAEIKLDNLFNGDKELGEAMNLFLNDNWKQVSSEIKPVLEDTIASIFKKFANKIFHKFPLDVLLPQ
ncbi:protein takeout-like [Atheta coriaria]|uniref:protein takeout-like n=1 Tax=Dalotia coriaria TaxID=877792 RepID=UPI0031F3869F